MIKKLFLQQTLHSFLSSLDIFTFARHLTSEWDMTERERVQDDTQLRFQGKIKPIIFYSRVWILFAGTCHFFISIIYRSSFGRYLIHTNSLSPESQRMTLQILQILSLVKKLDWEQAEQEIMTDDRASAASSKLWWLSYLGMDTHGGNCTVSSWMRLARGCQKFLSKGMSHTQANPDALKCQHRKQAESRHGQLVTLHIGSQRVGRADACCVPTWSVRAHL